MTEVKAKPGTLENAVGYPEPKRKPRAPRKPKVLALTLDQVRHQASGLGLKELIELREWIVELINNKKDELEQQLKLITG